MVLLINSDINNKINIFQPNLLNTIYVISNMHLNFNLGIRPNGHSTSQKVQPLCECLGSIPRFVSIYIVFYFCLHILFLFASNSLTIV
jgi:hypothetical protein